MKFGIASIFKNELDYILEWVAYHRVIGVSHFIIEDNVSDDGSSELLQALDMAGIITRVPFPRASVDVGPQAQAYNKILEEHGRDFDLLAFIDADEFIFVEPEYRLDEVLQELNRIEDCSAIGLNWAVFGSNGFVNRSVGLVTDWFVRRGLKIYALASNATRHITKRIFTWIFL